MASTIRKMIIEFLDIFVPVEYVGWMVSLEYVASALKMADHSNHYRS